MLSNSLKPLEKDLEFFRLFLLLINKACPIKRVDCVWVRDGPVSRVGLRQKTLCTEGALASPCARLLPWGSGPEPDFCNLVNDYARHEKESCAISDRAAELRVLQTRKPYVYQCHAGLIDIAVPVFSGGQHIATLLTGQVLLEPPSREGFEQIRKLLAPLTYIDWGELEKAYWQVPVVTNEDIESTTRVLEIFAEHLATTWQRLVDAVREEQRNQRELQLCRKEFAHLVLEGVPADPAGIRDLMAKLGFTRHPNRVLVIKLESEEEYHTPATPFELAFTRALQAVEEICDQVPNTCCTSLRYRGICVFFSDQDDGMGFHPGFRAHVLAAKVLNAIHTRSDMHARAGIGNAVGDWHALLDSYQEACVALAQTNGPIASFQKVSTAGGQLAGTVSRLCRLLDENRSDEVRRMLASLPREVNREIGDRPENLTAQQHFFSYVLDSLGYVAQRLGAGTTAAERRAGQDALVRSTSIFHLQETFLGAAQALVEQVRQIYSGNHDKLVERACRKIDNDLADPAASAKVSLKGIAAPLGISPGHLSRLFRRRYGLTFERYLMIRRIELARRMLLDPFHKVAGVAELCGFSDPTYFSRVFRKITGCSPRDYRENPLCAAPPSSPEGAPGAAGAISPLPQAVVENLSARR